MTGTRQPPTVAEIHQFHGDDPPKWGYIVFSRDSPPPEMAEFDLSRLSDLWLYAVSSYGVFDSDRIYGAMKPKAPGLVADDKASATRSAEQHVRALYGAVGGLDMLAHGRPTESPSPIVSDESIDIAPVMPDSAPKIMSGKNVPQPDHVVDDCPTCRPVKFLLQSRGGSVYHSDLSCPKAKSGKPLTLDEIQKEKPNAIPCDICGPPPLRGDGHE